MYINRKRYQKDIKKATINTNIISEEEKGDKEFFCNYLLSRVEEKFKINVHYFE